MGDQLIIQVTPIFVKSTYIKKRCLVIKLDNLTEFLQTIPLCAPAQPRVEKREILPHRKIVSWKKLFSKSVAY